MCTADNYKGEFFSELSTSIRRGDIIGVEGHPGKSKTGELSIRPSIV